MNSEHFCLVNPVIDIFLNFLGLIEDHMACGDHYILPVQEKMGLSSGHIENLKIDAPSGTVSRESGPGVQAVGAADSHYQRPCLIFKVYHGIVQITGIHVHDGGSFRQNYIYIILCMVCPIQFMDEKEKNFYNIYILSPL